MKFKAVLFDLDGTLLNTLEDIADSMNYVLQQNGYPVHVIDRYRYFVGDGLDTLVRRALPDYVTDDKVVNSCLAAMKARYSSNWNVKTAPYEGIDAVLNHLKRAGCIISVLSNKVHELTTQMVDYYFDATCFSMVIGAGRFKKKPDPQAALFIAESIGVDVSECLFVGDSAVDMNTARAAGMNGAGALWGFREKIELVDNGAGVILEDPFDLLPYVGLVV
jgi:phosphoglycolate phosphatase